MESPLFSRESKGCDFRKKLIRKEIQEMETLLKWMKSKADKVIAVNCLGVGCDCYCEPVSEMR